MGERFVNFVVGRPWFAMLAGLLILGVLMPGGENIRADFSYRVWFADDDPLIVEFDAFERQFGNDESTMVVMHSPSGIFDEDSAKLLIDLTDRLWKMPDVMRVDSLANFNWVHADGDDIVVEPMLPDDEPLTPELLAARKKASLAHETLPGWLISEDGKTTVLFATLKPALDKPLDHAVSVEAMKTMLAELTAGDHAFHLTGGGPLNYFFKVTATADLKVLFPVAIGLIILLLALLFRRVAGVLLPLVVVVLTVMGTMTLSGHLGIPLSNMTTILPQVVMAIAIADAVHILVSYFRGLRSGLARAEAARYSLQKNLQPTILTTLSTVAGFLSFSTAEVMPIAHLGLLAAAGTVLAWLFTYLVLGPLIVLLPLRARGESLPDLETASPRATAIANWINGRRPLVLASFGVLTALAIGFSMRSQVNSDPYTYFAPGTSLRVASDFIEAHVGGSLATEMVIDSGAPEGVKDPKFLANVERYQAWIEAKPFVSSANSIVDILKSMNRSFNADDPAFYKLPDTRRAIAELNMLYTMSLPQGMNLNDRITLKNDALRLTSFWTIHDSRSVNAAIDDVVAKSSDFGLKAHITGKGQLWQRMNPAVVRTFVVSLLTALVAMSLLLVFAFRSVKLGLLAMVPNGVPLLFGAGLLAAIGKPLDVGTVVVFSVCLGIAVDDTVHFLSNFNRLHSAGGSAHDAVAYVFTHTMPALVVTTIVLVTGFGAFAFATFVPNQMFGIMVATILSFALFTDAVLLPALLAGKGAPKG